ncbi:C2H2 transcription factor [Fusarium tjaetaba]|uniref:C2H2 transcription factor n=1 Tax=Fusarium tjaetaba TaxID=1567544 RepID=A0A8H5QL87_9HYPO|nr:C2H2 transcription factor [Fusarium tjaetaba]KAF5616784.1 C2H2 transcription factor [Fusarium tjaetaba]
MPARCARSASNVGATWSDTLPPTARPGPSLADRVAAPFSSNCRRKSIECVNSSLAEQNSHHPQGSVDLNGSSLNTFQSQDAHGSDTLASPVSFGDARSFSDPASSTLASDIFSFSHAGNYPWFDLFDTSGSLSEIFSSTAQAPGTYSFDFLSIFTNKTELIHSFDCGSHRDRLKVVSEFSRNEPEAAEHQSPDNTIDSNSLVSAVNQNQITQEPLTLRTYEILLQMKSAFDSKPKNSCITQEWSFVMEQQCLEFFSPKRIRKYLALYWEIWHPNINFIHRPTFDPMSCKLGLMAAMLVIGASVSPNPSDLDQAKQWYSPVEEIVFTDQEFLKDRNAEDNTIPLAYNSSLSEIQAMQAAYLVSMFAVNITVYNAIRVFSKSEMTEYMVGQFADLGPLNLFAVVAGKK